MLAAHLDGLTPHRHDRKVDWATSFNNYAPAVQAASSIVALAIALLAVILPALQQSRRRRVQDRERQLKARCVATAIRFELHSINALLAKHAAPAVAHSSDQSPSGTLGAQFFAYKIDVPPLLASSVDQVYLLGEPAGPTLLRLIAVLNAYNEAVDRETTLGFIRPTDPASDRWQHLLGLIRDIQPIVSEALAQVEPIAEGR